MGNYLANTPRPFFVKGWPHPLQNDSRNTRLCLGPMSTSEEPLDLRRFKASVMGVRQGRVQALQELTATEKLRGGAYRNCPEVPMALSPRNGRLPTEPVEAIRTARQKHHMEQIQRMKGQKDSKAKRPYIKLEPLSARGTVDTRRYPGKPQALSKRALQMSDYVGRSVGFARTEPYGHLLMPI